MRVPPSSSSTPARRRARDAMSVAVSSRSWHEATFQAWTRWIFRENVFSRASDELFLEHHDERLTHGRTRLRDRCQVAGRPEDTAQLLHNLLHPCGGPRRVHDSPGVMSPLAESFVPGKKGAARLFQRTGRAAQLDIRKGVRLREGPIKQYPSVVPPERIESTTQTACTARRRVTTTRKKGALPPELHPSIRRTPSSDL